MKYLGILIIVFSVSFAEAQTANFWTKKGDFPGLKRERAVSFVIGDLGYVGTGVDTAEMVFNDFWSYDPVLDVWAQVANFPGVPRRNASAFSIGDYGYVGAGMDNAFAGPGNPTSDFYKYHGPTNSWSPIAPLPGLPIYFGTAFSVNGKGYYACGKYGPNNYSAQLHEYNPATDTWTPKAPFPGGVRYQLSSFTIENDGYVGLGTDQDVMNDDFWKYTPATDTWVQIADLPASDRASSHTFTIGQRAYVCMGNNGGLLDDLWEYNPYTDDWEVRATYGGSRRKNGVGFSINGKGYVGLGKGYSGKKMSMHEYTPPEVVSVDELNITELSVYPNPAINTIKVLTESTEIESLEIHSLNGTLIKTTEYTNHVDLSELTTGTYLLIAKSENGHILAHQRIQKH